MIAPGNGITGACSGKIATSFIVSQIKGGKIRAKILPQRIRACADFPV